MVTNALLKRTLNHQSFQAIDIQSCGAYVLMFLIHCSLGGSLDTFQKIFSKHDFVKNDHRVAHCFKSLARRDLEWHRMNKQFEQSNHVPVRLMDIMETDTVY